MSELKRLRDKGVLFNEFMMERQSSPQLNEAYKESNKLIESSFQSGNIKPLKVLSADIDDQIMRHMPLSWTLELQKRFKANLIFDVDSIKKAYLKTIQAVVKKGNISSREEYEVLLNRVDEMYNDPGKESELKQLQQLLAEYKEG